MITEHCPVCEKCGKASLRRFGGLCPACERKAYDWKEFYINIRRYAVGKTSRERFEFDWAQEQKAQGIKAARLRRI
jgi:hypothetical protein